MSSGVLALDYGGTLATPSPRVTAAGLAAVARARYGDRLPADVAIAWNDAFAAERRAEREGGRQRPLSAILSSMLRRYDIDDDGVALVDALFDSIGDGTPLPAALPFLRWARNSGFECVIASNTYRPLRVRETTLSQAGLRPYVRTVLLSSELGVRKPHPEFFSAVIAGADAQRVVFIGDTLDKDVLGPLAAGMSAILVAGAPLAQPVGHAQFLGRVAHLDEIPAVLQRWQSNAA